MAAKATFDERAGVSELCNSDQFDPECRDLDERNVGIFYCLLPVGYGAIEDTTSKKENPGSATMLVVSELFLHTRTPAKRSSNKQELKLPACDPRSIGYLER